MRIITSLLLCFCFIAIMSENTLADEGDTTIVRSHDATDMTWKGKYDAWAEFPSEGKSYRKVKLRYTLGCASDRCSDWDYTASVKAIKPTGRYDSTKKQWPTFRVNGQTRDSIKFSKNPTYQTYYDTPNQVTDSFKRDSITIVRFQDPNKPTMATDTMYVWPANYYNKKYNTSGDVVDSHLVKADKQLKVSYRDYYDVFEIKRNIELASGITPYGGYMARGQNGYSNDWKHTMIFDVTDFQQYLKDSIKIRVDFGCYPRNGGFSASVDFVMEEGTPARTVKNIYKLYQGHYDYNNANDFEQNKMPQVSVNLEETIDQAKVRVIGSGHGFDNDKNCAEFCKKNYFLNVNGQQQASQLLWKDDCGMNPTYPQAGTWLLDRANWCPGTRVKVYQHEVGQYLDKGQNTLNLDMETINWSGDQQPSYHFAIQLITYEKANHNLDASIKDIIAPSSKDEHGRKNPVAMEPVVEVKNTGSKKINKIKFTYSNVGNGDNTYTWEGTIKPYKTKTIDFPSKINNFRKGDTVFKVAIDKVNGKSDDYKANDQMTSHFKAPPVIPNEFRIFLTTNAQSANQNTIKLVDASGKVHYERQNLENSTRYRDTVSLPEGYGEYKFVLEDDDPNRSSGADENGLYYQFLQQAGRGRLSFVDIDDQFEIIKDFESNFGSKITYHFTTNETLWGSRKSEASNDKRLEVYPNPTKGHVQLKLDGDHEQLNQIRVLNSLGKVVHSPAKPLQTKQSLDLSHLDPGVYVIRARSGDEQMTRKVLLY